VEKARFLEGKRGHPFPFCSPDVAKVAKLSVPQFSHMWKTPQPPQDSKIATERQLLFVKPG